MLSIHTHDVVIKDIKDKGYEGIKTLLHADDIHRRKESTGHC